MVKISQKFAAFSEYMNFTKQGNRALESTVYNQVRFQIKWLLKFLYSEKARTFCEISTVDLSYVVTVKSTVEISQNFVAFSEYMNFTMMATLLKKYIPV